MLHALTWNRQLANGLGKQLKTIKLMPNRNYLIIKLL